MLKYCARGLVNRGASSLEADAALCDESVRPALAIRRRPIELMLMKEFGVVCKRSEFQLTQPVADRRVELPMAVSIIHAECFSRSDNGGSPRSRGLSRQSKNNAWRTKYVSKTVNTRPAT